MAPRLWSNIVSRYTLLTPALSIRTLGFKASEVLGGGEEYIAPYVPTSI
jgi:hypothetical protein